MRFEHCPKCGASLIGKEIGDEGIVPFCPACQKPWFDMFSTCVISLVLDENNQALVLRQDYLSTVHGNLVSGYMKPGESAEDAAKREIAEETGLSVQKLELVKTYWYQKKGLLMIGFFAHVQRKSLLLSDEVDDAHWLPLDEALSSVHEEGTVSHSLVSEYITRLGGTA